MIKKSLFVFFFCAIALVFSCAGQICTISLLTLSRSWNEGKAKQSIIDFVNDVTNETSPNFVKPEDRIATFDNDGTLWSEQPYYFQFQFASR